MNQQTNMVQKHYIFASDNWSSKAIVRLVNIVIWQSRIWYWTGTFAFFCLMMWQLCSKWHRFIFWHNIWHQPCTGKDGWRRIKSSVNQRKFWAFGVGWLLKRRRSKDKTDLLDFEIPTFVPHWNGIMGAAIGQRGSGIYPGKDSRL